MVLATLAPPVAAASEVLTEARVRAFVARQQAAWNREDAEGYFAGFTQGAVFVEQTRTPKGEPILYGKSVLAAAKGHAKRYFAQAEFTDTTVIETVRIAADGRSARVVGRKVSQVEIGTRRRTICAITEQTVVASGGRILSRGETNTTTRCRDAG